ncbi:hypothetical protein FRB93_010178 [Tulasnella sp. JGI-2019a]|nr:hypothetical protein FRB93_010178 [Tulasnella sp. JGI-2019a]
MLAATYQIFIAPLVERVHAPADPTYGRYLLPLSPFEAALAADTELCADIRRRRVFIEVDGSIGSGEDITFTKTDLKRGRGKKWVHYQVWTSSQGEKGVAAGCDIVLVHGLGDYGAIGKWASHVTSLLRHGFRVIAPDLPGVRSSSTSFMSV